MIRAVRKAGALTAIALWSAAALCDRAAYSDTTHLQAQAGKLIANHCHDWSKLTLAKGVDGWQQAYSSRTPFGVSESVSNLELYTPDGRTLVRMTSPPLRYLTVTPDGRYVVGLSDVMFLNATQLLVVDRTGAVAMRRSIRAEQFCFTDPEFTAFRKKYGSSIREMSKAAEVTGEVLAWRLGGKVFFDPIAVTAGPAWDAMFSELYPRRCDSTYSSNISESTTNWVHWYDRRAPNVEIVERDGRVWLVRVRDPNGVVMEIPAQQDVVLPTAFRFVEPRLKPEPLTWACSRDSREPASADSAD